MSKAEFFATTSQSLSAKVFILLILVLASGIPRSYVDGIIEDRRLHEDVARQSVVSGWAAQHQFGKVTMHVPYRFIGSLYSDTPDVKSTVTSQVAIDPSNVKLEVKDSIDIRRRGIYRFPIYKAVITMSGDFVVPAEYGEKKVGLQQAIDNEQTILFETKNAFAISEFEVILNGERYPIRRTSEGLKIELKHKTFHQGDRVQFILHAQLNGFETIAFATKANELDLQMTSAWKNPSFRGQLPQEQQRGKNGFTAHWKLFQPEVEQVISVAYMPAVDSYTESNRTLKYGMLITLLCLSTVFLMELLTKVKIHPMQYLLLTLPLSAFYMLLTALAEQIGFITAYAIAAFAVILLIHFYYQGIGASKKQALGLSGLLTMVYGLILVMLTSEDQALLIGAISLFACLSTFMLLTRHIDWSKTLPKGSSKPETETPPTSKT